MEEKRVSYVFPAETKNKKERRKIFQDAIREWTAQGTPLDVIIQRMKEKIDELQTQRKVVVASAENRKLIPLLTFFAEIKKNDQPTFNPTTRETEALSAWINFFAKKAQEKGPEYVEAMREIGIIEDNNTANPRKVRIVYKTVPRASECLPAELLMETDSKIYVASFLESIGILVIADTVLKDKPDQVKARTNLLKKTLLETENFIPLIESWLQPEKKPSKKKVQVQEQDEEDDTEEMTPVITPTVNQPDKDVAYPKQTHLKQIFQSETKYENEALQILYGWGYTSWTGSVQPWLGIDLQPAKFGIMQILYYMFDLTKEEITRKIDSFNDSEYGLKEMADHTYRIENYSKWNNMIVKPLNKLLGNAGSFNGQNLGKKQLDLFRVFSVQCQMTKREELAVKILQWPERNDRNFDRILGKLWAISLQALLYTLIDGVFTDVGSFKMTTTLYQPMEEEFKKTLELLPKKYVRQTSQIGNIASILECIETRPEYMNNPGRIASELYEPIQDHLDSNGVPAELTAAVVHLGLTDPLFHKVSLNVDMTLPENQMRYLRTLSAIATMLDKQEYPISEVDRCFSEWPY